MQSLIYDRVVSMALERVRIRAFRVRNGFILERTIERMFATEDVDNLPMQVLPVESLEEFDEFAEADPFYLALQAAYSELRTKLQIYCSSRIEQSGKRNGFEF